MARRKSQKKEPFKGTYRSSFGAQAVSGWTSGDPSDDMASRIEAHSGGLAYDF